LSDRGCASQCDLLAALAALIDADETKERVR
jgi:hypothetical protein